MESVSRYTRGGMQTRSAVIKESNRRNEPLSNARNEESPPLPNEVWAMILEHVHPDDLLPCRLVNRLWYSISSSICRKRFLQLNFSKILGNPGHSLTSFYFTFKNCKNLPWSACKLELDEYHPTGRSNTVHLPKFIRLFGKDIHELTISGDNNDLFLSIMNGVPNVSYLSISHIRLNKPIIEESFTAKLRKLKGLIASIDDYKTFRFFELLLKRPEVQLRSLQLTIRRDYDLSMGNCEVLSTLITGIPILYLVVLSFSPELFTELTRKRVQVHLLIVNLDAPLLPTSPDFYSSFVEFLKNTADSLKNLALFDCQAKQQIVNSKLTVPTLPKLTFLAVITGTTRRQPLLTNVTPFSSDQFPKLVAVVVCVSARTDRMTLFGSGPFDTVTELVVTNMEEDRMDPFEAQWHRIFPNLKYLSATVTGDGLELILTKLKRLERLSVTVRWRRCQQVRDVSTLLSGGRQFGNEPQGGKCASQEGESGTASLLSLTQLKELNLDVSPEDRMCDVFVDSYLLKIQPLDNLCFENVIISEENKEKLQKYHRKAEIHKHRIPDQLKLKKFSEFEEMR